MPSNGQCSLEEVGAALGRQGWPESTGQEAHSGHGWKRHPNAETGSSLQRVGGISDAQRKNTLAYLVVLPICGLE